MTYTGQKATFDAAAAKYDAVRPSYPDALIQAVIDLSGLPDGGRILEIGCGTGQATLPFASRGYTMLCLEPGPNLAAAAARNLQIYPRVAIQQITFEDWPPDEEGFDLVISAQAFHWIPAEVGYPKAAQGLKPTGSIALFWNLSPDAECEEVQQVYRRCAPEMAQAGDNRLAAKVRSLEEQLQAHGTRFRDAVVQQFPWSVRYQTAQYIDLLNTYSDHLTLPEDRRKCLHGGIAQVINRHGGSLLKEYVAVVLVARRV